MMLSNYIQRAVKAYRDLQIACLGEEMKWRSIGHGLQMKIDPRDPMDRAFYLGNYDRWLVRAIRNWVKPGDICIDVGAHKGYVTLLLAKFVGPTGCVFAFEPDPRARQILRENCERNNLQNISVLPFALGEKQGEGKLALSSQLGWSSMFPNNEARATTIQVIPVQIRSFDGLVETGVINLNPGRLNFVKIDAEGAEPLILCGMQALLQHTSPILWLEVNCSALEVAASSFRDIYALLKRWQFSLYLPKRYRSLLIFPTLRLEPMLDPGMVTSPVVDIVAVKNSSGPEMSVDPIPGGSA